MASKKNMPAVRRVRVGGTPVPMPTRTTPRTPGSAVPVPMPTRKPNLGSANPAKARRAPSGPKKSIVATQARKPKPLETTRIGGIISIPKKRKKTIY